jgi:tRNA A-37 threonylcarbamoyl transferase component Bud32
MEAAAVETVAPTTGIVARPIEAQQLAAPGSRVKYFGDYALIEEIARGGMGVVWKARQASLNRIVALKMILAGRFAGQADVKRFHTEAEAAANLQHPNIVAIHEIGEHEGQHYFSMDYVEGKSLAELVSDGPLPAAEAAALVKRIAEAVHYAHQRGTLHRDLKPSNVLIDAQGQPRITDFGLAKQLSRDSGLTQTGAVLGTPAYLPPEQANGRNEQVGPASDVYSIGAMFYHLLTGRAPFEAETPAATLRKAMEEEPVAPAKRKPGTPPDLETICLKCLEKRPERRYHSARELAEELGRFLNHEPILAKPAGAFRKGWSWAQRHPWVLLGIGSLIGLGLIGLAYGLWEQVQHLRWESLPPGPDKTKADRRGFAFEIYAIMYAIMIGWVVLGPVAVYSRALKDRQRRNLPVGSAQLTMLAVSGLIVAGMGIGCELLLIRFHVWHGAYPWYALVGLGLGTPFVFCWVGSIFVWQASQLHQARWSGAGLAGTDWIPLHPVHYSLVAFVAATWLNLALFTGIGYLLGRVLDAPFNQEGFVFGLTSFVFIAFGVSLACWVAARHQVNKLPRPVLVFFWVLFGGTVMVWLLVPKPWFVGAAAATGLVGGLLLAKLVPIRQAKPSAPRPAIRLDELFQWEKPRLSLTLATATVAVLLAAARIPHLYPGMISLHEYIVALFLGSCAVNTLLPPAIMAVRWTTGSEREFFLALLLFGAPLPHLVAYLFGPPHAQPMLVALAGSLAGVVAGCALVYFARVRPKAR